MASLLPDHDFPGVSARPIARAKKLTSQCTCNTDVNAARDENGFEVPVVFAGNLSSDGDDTGDELEADGAADEAIREPIASEGDEGI